MRVVTPDVFGKDRSEVTVTRDEHPAKTLLADGGDHASGKGISRTGPDGALDHPGGVDFEHPVNQPDVVRARPAVLGEELGGSQCHRHCRRVPAYRVRLERHEYD